MQEINKANSKKHIKGAVAIADGPGGSVSGTPQLGSTISESQKPIIAFVDGMAASAHYWTVSQADYIMGNEQEFTEVGSIGVLCGLISYEEALQKEGIKYEIKRAAQSVDKALLNQVEPWPEQSIEELENELNEMDNAFISTVARGRNMETIQKDGLLNIDIGGEIITSGKMYDLDQAMELGMVDYKGRLEDAIMLCADVASTREKSSIVV